MVDSSSADRDPIEKLAEEFLQRRRRGEAPSLAEYVERYPELADDIRTVFPTLLLMEQADPASSELDRAHTHGEQRPDGVPAQLGDFRILREIGRGGMGVVYEAEQVSLGRRVALKVLPPQALANPRYLSRFEREAKAAARLHHTNIVPVYGVGSDHGIHYYAMQFIQGQALNEVLAELKRLRHEKIAIPALSASAAPATPQASVAEVARSLLTGPAGPPTVDHVLPREASPPRGAERAERGAGSTAGGSGTLPGQSGSVYAERAYWQSVARVGIQAAEALAYAHSEGILHRDIKPSNLLLDARGHVWVADFGLAKTADTDDLTTTGDIVGTVRYMAPERFQGQTDVRSDVYSLGATLYELAALTYVFPETDGHKLIKQVTSEDPVHLRRVVPGLPRDLGTIIHTALERDPTRRYPSAAALAAELQRFLGDRPIQARPPGRAELFSRWCRRNPVVVGLLAAVVMTLVAGVTGIVMQWREAVANSLLAENNAKIADKRREEIEQINGQLLNAQAVANQQREAVQAANGELLTAQAKLRRTLYLSDMRLLPAAWAQDNLGLMLELLQRQVPQAGETDLRNFEWHYWNRLCHPESEVQIEGQKTPRGVRIQPNFAFNAAGTLLAGLQTDVPGLQLWDTRTGKVRSVLPRTVVAEAGRNSFVQHFAFSPDGKRVAACSNTTDFQKHAFDYQLTVWDAASGQELWHNRETHHVGYYGFDYWSVPHFLPGSYLAFDGAGSRLAACVVDGNKTFVKMWAADTGKPVLEFEKYDSAVCSFEGKLSFSPDGKRVLALVRGSNGPAGAVAGRLAVWDAATGKELPRVNSPAEYAQPLSFSFSTDALAVVWQPLVPVASGLQNTSAVWLHDPVTSKPLTVFEAAMDGGYVKDVQFSSDGKSLLTVSSLGRIASHDAGSQQLLRRIPNPLGKVLALGFDEDGKVLTVKYGGLIERWASAARPPVLPHDATATPYKPARPTLSADGRRAAIVFGDSSVSGVSAVALLGSPFGEGQLLAASLLSAETTRFKRDCLIQVRDTAVAAPLFTVKSDVGYYALSANGKCLAVFDWDRKNNVQMSVVVWDIDSGKQLAALAAERPRSIFCNLAVSADGKRVAVFVNPNADQSGRLSVWEVATSMRLLHREIRASSIENLGFSPDGKRIAYSQNPWGRDKPEFHVVDVRSGNDLWTRPWLGEYAFSADGRRLAMSLDARYGRPETLVVDAVTGEQQLRLEAADDRTFSVVFSPDGQRILTVGVAARLWDAATGEEILTLDRWQTVDQKTVFGFGGELRRGRFQFSDDGRRIFCVHTTSPQQTSNSGLAIRVWDATPLPDLRDLLAGTIPVANNRERLRLIDVCKRQHRYVAAARFYREMFAADPRLAANVQAGHRYEAACCGLRAAGREGIDADQLDDQERTRLREQALAWLRADLESWTSQLDDSINRPLALGTLRRWQSSPDLAGIRDRDAVAQLPVGQQQSCQQFWATVAAILQADVPYERGVQLEYKKQWAQAIAAYREALAIYPGSGQTYLRLGLALEATKNWDEAAAAYQKVVDLYPYAHNYARLGLALQAADLPDRAQAAFRRAAELDSKVAGKLFVDRALALKRQNQLDAAIAVLRSAIAINADYADAHGNLAWFLLEKQRWNEASAAARQAIELDPKVGWYHNNLGVALAHLGRFEEALAEYRKALDLPNSGAQAAANRKALEPLLPLLPRLKAVLKGEARPADATEAFGFAKLASILQQWHVATRLYESALAERLDLADDPASWHRYDAACCSVLAAAGRGIDPPELDDQSRCQLRQRALSFLRADLAVFRKRLADGTPKERQDAAEKLKHWQLDSDFVSVRGSALGDLPAAEQEAWRALWAEVAQLVNKAGAMAK